MKSFWHAFSIKCQQYSNWAPKELWDTLTNISNTNLGPLVSKWSKLFSLKVKWTFLLSSKNKEGKSNFIVKKHLKYPPQIRDWLRLTTNGKIGWYYISQWEAQLISMVCSKSMRNHQKKTNQKTCHKIPDHYSSNLWKKKWGRRNSHRSEMTNITRQLKECDVKDLILGQEKGIL